MRLIIVLVRQVLVGSLSELVFVCTYVCMSVTGLWLKYTSLCLVYPPFWHVPLMVPLHVMENSELTEDRRQWQAREWVQRHRRFLKVLNIILTVLHHFVQLTLSTCSAWGTWCACIYLVICLNMAVLIWWSYSLIWCKNGIWRHVYTWCINAAVCFTNEHRPWV